MFDAPSEIRDCGHVRKYTLSRNGEQLTCANALDLWLNDAEFRSFYIDVLRSSPFAVYRWETPEITKTTAGRPFEFVLVEAPEFAHTADRRTFSKYFTEDDACYGIVTFANLSNDATLVVPSPRAADIHYRHLAAFMRTAPDSQNHALWQTVARTALQNLTNRPVWLNTASGGVAWLHVRLDSYPKYYAYAPYRDALYKT